jgi:D-alanyl-D-alanine carboxypeptidase
MALWRGTRSDSAPARRGRRSPAVGPLRRRAALLVVTVISGCSDAGAQVSPETPAPSPSPEAAIERMIRDHAIENRVGVVALVERDGDVWRGAAGLDQKDHPVVPGARFDLGSTTKTFVATVVLQLVEEGRLSLDDTVARWLPASVDDPRVLIRHLLDHTSGLVETTHGHFAPAFAPGTAVSYSNLNYGLLEDIVLDVTGRSLDQEMRDRIAEPLGLDDTWLSGKRSSLPWLGAPEGSCRICVPGGEIGPFSTTADTARFFQALVRGELFSEELLAEMTETVSMGTELSAGMGLFRFDLPCGTAWGHGGEFTYYSNQVLVSGDGSTVVVFARGRGDWFTTKTLAEKIYCLAA